MSTAVFLGTGAELSANLALSLNPNATISTLSAQLLQKPRSAAGNKVNTWDCDPPDALQGMHYFAYNIGPTFEPVISDERVVTLRSFEPGPGYNINVQVLLRTAPNQTEFVAVSQGQQFDFPAGSEVGLARVVLTANGNPRGQIEPAADVDEIDYDAKDINGNPTNARGVEHVRFTTEYLDDTATADNLIAYGLMTTTVPTSFNMFAPGGTVFAEGFLDFGSTNISNGSNVFPAFVQTPEPASLAVIAGAAALVSRRRRA